MTTTTYNPDLWLESLTRALSAFVTAYLNDPDAVVEMSFPDTSSWTKETPLPFALVHFEIDDIQSPPIGFGIPGDVVIDDLADPPTATTREAVQHLVNFDVGVLVSAEQGGATKRMELTRKLHELFGSASGRQLFNTTLGGPQVVSFDGGQSQLDRVNDIPLWRMMGMQLIVRVFSRITQATPDVQIQDFDLDEELVIDDNGTLRPATTP